jgi:hypothetical protein
MIKPRRAALQVRDKQRNAAESNCLRKLRRGPAHTHVQYIGCIACCPVHCSGENRRRYHCSPQIGEQRARGVLQHQGVAKAATRRPIFVGVLTITFGSAAFLTKTSDHVKLSIGGSIHGPTDPVGRLLFNVLAMVAEFESDLIRARTREGMQVAKAKGRLRGKQPKLSKSQEAHLVSLYKGGQHTTDEIAELFKVARSTVYRIVQRTP